MTLCLVNVGHIGEGGGGCRRLYWSTACALFFLILLCFSYLSVKYMFSSNFFKINAFPDWTHSIKKINQIKKGIQRDS